MGNLSDRISARVDEIRDLKQNWDNDGSDPPRDELLDYIEAKAEVLGILFGDVTGIGMYPGYGGQVRFEFEVNGRMMELEIADLGSEP